MERHDVLEPDEVRSRDESRKEPPRKRRLATRLFRLGMKGLSVFWLGFRFLRWLADVLGL